MQSLFVGFVVVIIAISVLPQDTKSDKIADNQKLKKWDETCIKESGFNSSYAISFQNMPQNAKCYLACLLEQEGVLKSNGTIDLESVKQSIFIDSWLLEGLSEKYYSYLEDCVNETKLTPDDNCESAYDYMKCLYNKISEGSKMN